MYAAGENIEIQAQDSGNTDIQIWYACQPQKGECAGHGENDAEDLARQLFRLDAAVQQRRADCQNENSHNDALADQPQQIKLVISAQVTVVDRSAVDERKMPVMPMNEPQMELRNSAPM